MKYLYLFVFSVLFTGIHAQDCLTLDYENIKREYSERETDFVSFERAGFEFPQEKNLYCITVNIDGENYEVIPEPNRHVRLPDLTAYTSQFKDGSYITLLYFKSGERSIYYGNDDQEILIIDSADGRSQYKVTINELEQDFTCGNELDGVGLDHPNPIQNKMNGTCIREYELEVGAAADFEFLTRRASGSAVTANTIITGRFTGVATRYGDCDMRIIAVLIDLVIEPVDDLFFNTPHCLNRNNSNALKYNRRFADSPNRPNGDVITLWTGQELRGAGCIGDIGGMAFFIGNACERRKTNICQGDQGGRLWTHEIGHNIGVGLNHGNIPDGFFYGDTNFGDGPWHPNTVGTIHGTINNKSCIEKIDYCCTNFDDIVVCRDELINPVTWCASPDTFDDCIGTISTQAPNSALNDGRICGVLPAGISSMTVPFTQTTSLGCEFNSGTFRVSDCGATNPQFPFTPPVFNELCLDSPVACYSANCVESWIVTSTSGLGIQAIARGNEICISTFDFRPRQYQVCVRPVFECGQVGPIYCWNILTIECDDIENPRRLDTINSDDNISIDNLIEDESNDLNEVAIYPNPVSQILNIQGRQNMSNILMYNMNGELVKSIDCKSQSCKVNVSDLPQAVYVLLIKDQANEIIKTQRIIVQ